MLIRAGYDIRFTCRQPTPMMALLGVHESRHQFLKTQPRLVSDPDIPMHDYKDGFGNVATRFVLPEGETLLSNNFVIEDSGEPDRVTPDAMQHPVQELAGRRARLSAGQPLLRNRPAVGHGLGAVRPCRSPAGPGFRRSSTSPISRSSSATSTPARPRRRGTRIRNGGACAAITRTLPSRCAAA